jgi:predicted dehydrogenase
MVKICKVGLIGCGGMGRVHLSAYKKIPNAKVVAVADIDKKRASELARQVDAEWYEDYTMMLKRVDIDMVDVCLPVYLHSKAVIDAAEAGKHILCEKPISTNLKDADEMINATRRAGVKFMIAFMYRFDPFFIKIKQCVEDGTVGTPILMWLTNLWRPSFMEPGSTQTWFTDKMKSGGMLVEHTCHWIDQFRWWSGEAESVFAHIKTVEEGVTVEDNASVIIKFRNGAFATITQSWYSYLSWHDVGIVGKNGSAEMLGPYDVLKIRSKGKSVEEFKPILPSLPMEDISTLRYQREIEHFVECVLEDKTPVVSGIDGRAALEIALAAYRSSQEGKPITLPL